MTKTETSLSDPAKTTLEMEGRNLGVYVYKHFPAVKTHPIVLTGSKQIHVQLNEYLAEREKQMRSNQLVGIVGVKDFFPHPTGGRVHILVGLKGPVGKSFQPGALRVPIRTYKAKNIRFLEMIEAASGVKPPWAGNTHCHPFVVGNQVVDEMYLRKLIQFEHGIENDPAQIADFFFFELASPMYRPHWLPINNEGIKAIFS